MIKPAATLSLGFEIQMITVTCTHCKHCWDVYVTDIVTQCSECGTEASVADIIYQWINRKNEGIPDGDNNEE